jgi:amino acid transporter
MLSHGADSKSREAYGYVVWGIATAVVLIPEITAASYNHSPWPTISATVGHLEYLQSWVALIVVALIVAVAFSLLRYPQSARPAGQATKEPLRRRTSLGRLTRHSDDHAEVSRWMLVMAAAIVVSGSLLTSGLHPSDRFVLAYVLYGLIAVFFILIPSVLAFSFARDVPFPTLFRTIANLERRRHVPAVIITVGLVVLLIHLALYPWPSVFHQLQQPTPTSL